MSHWSKNLVNFNEINKLWNRINSDFLQTLSKWKYFITYILYIFSCVLFKKFADFLYGANNTVIARTINTIFMNI